MAEAVREQDIDCCGLGRPLRDDPDIPNLIFKGKKLSKL
jgi:2,4-dienoyl-CoA reductase-like NADH-dependent reductase (Old Yellow Enzyme family)